MININYTYYINSRFVLAVVFDVWTNLSADDILEAREWKEKMSLIHGQMTPSSKFKMAEEGYELGCTGVESYCVITGDFSQEIAEVVCSVAYELKEMSC